MDGRENLDADFKQNILAKLRDDGIGNLCRQVPMLLKFGEVCYGKVKRKKDKCVQVYFMSIFYLLYFSLS